MENIIPAMQNAVSNPVMIFSVLLFVAVVLFVMAGAAVLAGGDPVQRRLRARVGGAARPAAGHKRSKASQELLRKLEQKAAKDSEKSSAVRQKLNQAGYMGAHSVGAYYAARILMSGTLSVGILVMIPLVGDAVSTGRLLVAGILGATLGYFLPWVWVTLKVDKRQTDARIGFPDALDMLLVCVEAGLSLAAALNRVGQEIGTARPLLGEQFKLVALEMQAGKSREMALRNMADRIGIEEVRSLVTLLLQSEALGTSISQSLRVHADDMRRRRLVRAEEHANKLPAKMAVPLVCFILPSLMSVIMTPVAIRIVRNVLPALA